MGNTGTGRLAADPCTGRLARSVLFTLLLTLEEERVGHSTLLLTRENAGVALHIAVTLEEQVRHIAC